MLTISSIAVAPAPQATPTVRAQPVTPARPSNAVARENAAGTVVAPQGEAARAQAQTAPPLAPVTPAQEGQRADGFANGAAPERTGLLLPAGAAGQRGGDPAAQADEAAQARAAEQDRRAREAEAQRRAEAGQRRAESRTGETADRGDGPPAFPDVKNPAQEALDTQIKELLPNMWKASRAAVDMMIGEEAVEAAQERAKRLEELQTRLNARPLANVPADEAAQTYGAAADAGNRPAPGGQLDQLA